jgi:hypothetical protein
MRVFVFYGGPFYLYQKNKELQFCFQSVLYQTTRCQYMLQSRVSFIQASVTVKCKRENITLQIFYLVLLFLIFLVFDTNR